MSYTCRIDEYTTVTYSGGSSITITHEDNYWGRKETSSVSISNIDMLIKTLQDIKEQRSREW